MAFQALGSAAEAGSDCRVLAIYAERFDELSQTFVEDHVRTLAPGRTVLLCDMPHRADRFGAPVLAHVRPVIDGGSLAGRLRLLARRRLRRLRGGPPRGETGRVIAFLKAHDVSVVLAEFGWCGEQIFPACAEAGVPLVVHFHGADASSRLRHSSVRAEYARMFPHLAAAVTPSQAIAERLIEVGCPPEIIRVNPCGVEPDRFPVSAREPGRVLAVGRLTAKKAPDIAIRAFAAAAAAHPHARLDVVGDGELQELCARARDGSPRPEAIRLRGALPHEAVGALMASAALFIQHSVTGPDGDMEGFPVAILEAMAAGLPVVATRHSGIPEGVVDGETGFLVDERDEAGMAARIAALLADPALGARMGEAGRRRFLERFTAEHARRGLRAALGLGPAP